MISNAEKLTLNPGYRGYFPFFFATVCYSVFLYATFTIGVEKVLYVHSIGLDSYTILSFIHLCWKALLTLGVITILSYILWNDIYWFIQTRKPLELSPEGFRCGSDFMYPWSAIYGFYTGAQKGLLFSGELKGVFFELKSDVVPLEAYNKQLKPIQVDGKINLRQLNTMDSFQKVLPALSYRRLNVTQELSVEELAQLMNVWKQRYAPESKNSLTSTSWTVILGVSAEATVQEIRQAYRRQVKDRHPDQGGSPEAFIQLQTAYNQAMSNQHYIHSLVK